MNRDNTMPTEVTNAEVTIVSMLHMCCRLIQGLQWLQGLQRQLVANSAPADNPGADPAKEPHYLKIRCPFLIHDKYHRSALSYMLNKI